MLPGRYGFRLRAQERHELGPWERRRYDPAARKLHRAALSRHGVPSTPRQCNAPSTPSASITWFTAVTSPVPISLNAP